jgi:lysophospholipase L1-like esterase
MKITLIILLCVVLLVMGFVQKEERILFVGDSLSAYNGGWQHQVGRLRQIKYDNIAKGGKRTKWMLNQLKQYSHKVGRYTKVIIYGGINDSFSSIKEDDTIENIQKMVDIVREMGAEPIVIVGYNPQKVIQATSYPSEIETKSRNRYIELQKRIVTDIKRCTIIPMENGIGRTDSDDGIHLKASGHRKFANWILENL